MQDADSEQIAALAVLTWHKIEAALSPIIGRRGVAALYKRSLYLTQTEYPWLLAAYAGPLEPGDFTGLQAALVQQTPLVAATASRSLVQAFRDLVTNLIGGSLTEQLLRSVFNNSVKDDAK